VITCVRIGFVKDLAIIIVNFNVSNLLRNCLVTVFNSYQDISYEVCVVDNASEDNSAKMVALEFPQAHLIANHENVGYPSANNQGMRFFGFDVQESSPGYRYVLLLNPDTEVPPDAFTKLISYLDKNSEVGVIGPKLVLPTGELDLACRRSFPTPEVSFYRMIGLSRIFPRSKRFGRYNMTYLDDSVTAEIDSVVGAFMMVRAEAIQQVGLMDEQFWMYGEDLDWAKRIKDSGWKVVYYPEVSVLHIKRASSRHNRRARIEFYRAMLIFYYKYYRDQTSWFLHWLVLIGIAIKGGRSSLGYVMQGSSIVK